MTDETFGALELTASTLTIMSIIALCLLVLSTSLYCLTKSPIVGLVPHFVGFVLTTVLMATWLTSSIDWNELGTLPVIGAAIVLAVSWLVPRWLAFGT